MSNSPTSQSQRLSHARDLSRPGFIAKLVLMMLVNAFGVYGILASYGQVKDKTLVDADASKWAIGARYALSKRTELYADYAQIKNDRNASFTINPMGNSLGLSGNGVNGFAVGMKHAF